MFKSIWNLIKKPFIAFWHASLLWKIIIIVVIVIIFGIITSQIQNANKSNGYLLEKVKVSSLTEIVTESGEITADGKIAIYSPTNGIIEKISVANGQKVKTGQELFRVKSSATEQEKQTAYSNYLGAKAMLDSDNATMFSLQSTMYTAWQAYMNVATSSTYQNSDGSANTSNRVLTNFTTVEDNWFAAEGAFKNQQNVIAKDQAALNSASLAYQATQNAIVKATVDGIVSNLSVSLGSAVSAVTTLTSNPKPVLSITNNNSTEAMIPVGQSNISKVEPGQSVTLNPDAYKEKKYHGKVVRVDTLGENKQGVVTYNVYVQVTDGNNELKPGMTLDGDIVTKQLANILTVPNSAIVLDKGVKSVRVLDKITIQNLFL
jgi:HlyD family secretion protein